MPTCYASPKRFEPLSQCSDAAQAAAVSTNFNPRPSRRRNQSSVPELGTAGKVAAQRTFRLDDSHGTRVSKKRKLQSPMHHLCHKGTFLKMPTTSPVSPLLDAPDDVLRRRVRELELLNATLRQHEATLLRQAE